MTKKIFTALAAMALVVPFFADAAILNRSLDVGSTGTDVSALQTFLAGDATLYPQGLVTGYYGFLTKSAVSNFQSRNGIDPVGRVGPVTLPVLNAQMAGGMTGTPSVGSAPTITSVAVSTSNTSANVSWNTNESAKGVVYYSTGPLSTYENKGSVNIGGSSAMTDAAMRSSQTVSLSGLQANTTYYYMVYSTDVDGNVSVTWPSTFRTTN